MTPINENFFDGDLPPGFMDRVEKELDELITVDYLKLIGASKHLINTDRSHIAKELQLAAQHIENAKALLKKEREK